MLERLYEFKLWLADDPRDLDEWSGALLAAGADDSSPGISCGKPYVTFHRDAASLEEAIRSAHQDVVTAGLRVLRLEIEAEELAAWNVQGR